MGTAASILTSDDASTVTKELREDYERLRAAGTSDDEIQTILTAKYNDYLAQKQPNSEISEAKSSDLGLNKKSASGETKAKKARKRRGTFENEKTFSPSAKKEATVPTVSDPAALIAQMDATLGAATAELAEASNVEKSRGSFTSPTASSTAKKHEDTGGRSEDRKPMPQLRRRLSSNKTTADGGGDESVSARGTRRRSFEQAKNIRTNRRGSGSRPAPNKDNVDPTLLSSASAPVLDPPSGDSTSVGEQPSADGESEDCWESVTEQPYCIVCQMAFITIAKLEQHTNYSVVHAKNVKLAEPEPDTAASEEVQAPPPVASPNGVGVPQNENHQEGVHYKLMYSGSKFFWRTQDTVDLDLYHHVEAKSVEAIVFDVQTHKELKRLYFDLDAISEIVKSEVDAAVEIKRKSDRFSSINVPQLVEEHHRLAVTTFIISRLQLEHDSQTKSKSLKFNSQDMRPLLEHPPAKLTPVHVSRRRKTNDDAQHALMDQIAADRAAIGQATQMAADSLEQS